MKPLPLTPELEAVARRCVWFKEPTQAIRYPMHFIAHILTFGRREDVRVLERYLSGDDLAKALHHAPPGIYDPRSWAYWHARIGVSPPPKLPERALAEPMSDER